MGEAGGDNALVIPVLQARGYYRLRRETTMNGRQDSMSLSPNVVGKGTS